MRINVLGPIEIISDGRVRSPGGPGQRALLATLALDHGRVVTVDRLTRILWADRPPATARTKIQAHVSALRQVMGHSPADAGSPLLTVPPGYLLADQAVDLDLAEFSGLMSQGLAAAETGEPAAAAELLGQALALWRGTAFTGVSAIPILAAAEGLDARRLMAADAKAEADLELGRYATVVTELSALLIAHPLRERSRGLAMLALDRLGCRADALSLYRSGEQALRRELGIEPGGWLRGVYERILTSDPGIGPGPEDSRPRPFRRIFNEPGAGGSPARTEYGATAVRAGAHRATRNP
jgi:DNA-binding SARP family transcriptional activator